MEKLINWQTKTRKMVDDYKARVSAAANRIITLGAELQSEKDAMTAAAAADDMTTYREHEARMRFLSARIEEAKKEQTAPLLSSAEEALALNKEYNEAIREATAPINARVLDLISDLETILSDLKSIHQNGSINTRLANACRDHNVYLSSYTLGSILSNVLTELKKYAGTVSKL